MNRLKSNSDIEFVIKPTGSFSLQLKELWEYRELFYYFTWRDIKVKYKQTLLGFLWAVLQPFILMLVFTVFFGGMLKVPSADESLPYPIFAYSGLMLWNIFATGLAGSGNSMVTNANIIKKIYFPRLIIPMSSILSAIFDFIMAFLVYIGILIYFQYMPPIEKLVLLLPLSILMAIFTSFGLGCFMAALNVKYRDFRYVIPFLTQLLFFLTPVIYPIKMVTNEWARILLSLNPMGGVVHLSRAALIDKPVNWELVGISGAVAVLMILAGIIYFKRTESYFADIA